jgi:hypothetical protein
MNYTGRAPIGCGQVARNMASAGCPFRISDLVLSDPVQFLRAEIPRPSWHLVGAAANVDGANAEPKPLWSSTRVTNRDRE